MVQHNTPQPVKFPSQTVVLTTSREVAADVGEPACVNPCKLWFPELIIQMGGDDTIRQEGQAHVEKGFNSGLAAGGDQKVPGINAWEATEILINIQHKLDDGIAQGENVINVATGETELAQDKECDVLPPCPELRCLHG